MVFCQVLQHHSRDLSHFEQTTEFCFQHIRLDAEYFIAQGVEVGGHRRGVHLIRLAVEGNFEVAHQAAPLQVGHFLVFEI